jgi:hypothetical protein
MRIEILYVPGCPNYQPTVERLQAVLESQLVQAEVRSIAIRTEAQAKAVSFPGSPTIRIEGKDVEPSRATAPGLACRLYKNGSGVPSEDTLRAAIEAEKRSRRCD